MSVWEKVAVILALVVTHTVTGAICWRLGAVQMLDKLAGRKS